VARCGSVHRIHVEAATMVVGAEGAQSHKKGESNATSEEHRPEDRQGTSDDTQASDAAEGREWHLPVE
jgi:hypothetical protein